jgi:hypothetical protein
MKTLFKLFLLLFSYSLLSIASPIDIGSILKTGDGKSLKTAYKVNSVNEEYDVLRYLNLKPIMQKLYIKDGVFYDEITTNSKTIFFKVINKKLQSKIIPQII